MGDDYTPLEWLWEEFFRQSKLTGLSEKNGKFGLLGPSQKIASARASLLLNSWVYPLAGPDLQLLLSLLDSVLLVTHINVVPSGVDRCNSKPCDGPLPCWLASTDVRSLLARELRR